MKETSPADQVSILKGVLIIGKDNNQGEFNLGKRIAKYVRMLPEKLCVIIGDSKTDITIEYIRNELFKHKARIRDNTVFNIFAHGEAVNYHHSIYLQGTDPYKDSYKTIDILNLLQSMCGEHVFQCGIFSCYSGAVIKELPSIKFSTNSVVIAHSPEYYRTFVDVEDIYSTLLADSLISYYTKNFYKLYRTTSCIYIRAETGLHYTQTFRLTDTALSILDEAERLLNLQKTGFIKFIKRKEISGEIDEAKIPPKSTALTNAIIRHFELECMREGTSDAPVPTKAILDWIRLYPEKTLEFLKSLESTQASRSIALAIIKNMQEFEGLKEMFANSAITGIDIVLKQKVSREALINLRAHSKPVFDQLTAAHMWQIYKTDTTLDSLKGIRLDRLQILTSKLAASQYYKCKLKPSDFNSITDLQALTHLTSTNAWGIYKSQKITPEQLYLMANYDTEKLKLITSDEVQAYTEKKIPFVELVKMRSTALKVLKERKNLLLSDSLFGDEPSKVDGQQLSKIIKLAKKNRLGPIHKRITALKKQDKNSSTGRFKT